MACAVWLLAGCVGWKHDNTIPVNIAFRPVIGYDTRATESIPVPEDQTFKVWAQEDFSGALYIEGEEISYNGGWKSPKVWTDNDMSFQACWPIDLPVSYSRGNGLQINGFDCRAGDVDILWAKAHSENEIDGVLVLPFDHLLSRVEFRMKHSLPENTSVRVKKITIRGIAQTGDYNTKKKNQWTSTDYDETRVVFDVGNTVGIDIPAGATPYIGDDFYAIPQVSAPMVEVVYDVRFGNAEWIEQSAEVGPLDTEWDSSKHYTYTLNLRMDKMVYTSGISSWNNRE